MRSINKQISFSYRCSHWKLCDYANPSFNNINQWLSLAGWGNEHYLLEWVDVNYDD